MKKFALPGLAFTLLVAVTTFADAAPTPAPGPSPKPPLVRITCPDIAVSFGGAVPYGRTGPNTARAHFMGTWRNVGNAPFVTGPKQSWVRLYELRPGEEPRLVKEEMVDNLAADGRAPHNNFKYTYDYVNSPKTTTSSFRFVFTHATDVRECNDANNEVVVTAAQLDAVFPDPR
jgi:hypothetical protein